MSLRQTPITLLVAVAALGAGIVRNWYVLNQMEEALRQAETKLGSLEVSVERIIDHITGRNQFAIDMRPHEEVKTIGETLAEFKGPYNQLKEQLSGGVQEAPDEEIAG